jgi:hypothetical protein
MKPERRKKLCSCTATSAHPTSLSLMIAEGTPGKTHPERHGALAQLYSTMGDLGLASVSPRLSTCPKRRRADARA